MAEQANPNQLIDPFVTMKNYILMGGMANVPEFGGAPHEDIEEFLKKFARATSALNQEQKCIVLKRALVGDANVFQKNYLKQHLLLGEWKCAKALLRKRFSKIEPSLLYRTELKRMVFDPSRNTLLGYVDQYAKLYRKIHSQAKDNELIQDLSLNLGNNIILRLNQLSDNWKDITDFEAFRSVITRLEKDIMALEAEATAINAREMANTVNLAVSSALQSPLKQFQDLLIQLSQTQSLEPDTEKLAAVKHGRYPEDTDRQARRDPIKRRDREWEEDRDRYKTFVKRARELREAYEEKYGKVDGPCFLCGGHHLRKHCPLDLLNLKELGDRR